MSEVTKRIEWIDTAKGIGILMVMLGHDYLDWKFVFWCYSCHMALFFFLSGCTFKLLCRFQIFFKKESPRASCTLLVLCDFNLHL